MRELVEHFFYCLYLACSSIPENARKVNIEIDNFLKYFQIDADNLIEKSKRIKLDKVEFGFELLDQNNFREIIKNKFLEYLDDYNNNTKMSIRIYDKKQSDNFNSLIQYMKLENVNLYFYGENLSLIIYDLILNENNNKKINILIDSRAIKIITYLLNYKENEKYDKNVFYIKPIQRAERIVEKLELVKEKYDKIIISSDGRKYLGDKLEKIFNSRKEIKNYKVTDIFVEKNEIESIILVRENVENYNYNIKLHIENADVYNIKLQKYIEDDFDIENITEDNENLIENINKYFEKALKSKEKIEKIIIKNIL